ncbi:MAG: PD-(D/E)XK nuclease family protein [Halothece sp. Uz-M2-17]|nr:PD-(D/E)XK nuclease family protein [Halothece sp. Uz-M2-17]
MIETIWQLSQNHLNLLSTCRRKFQYTYLEQFTSPCLPQRQSQLTLGNRFHHFMQQRELGLPVERLLAVDQKLAKSFQALAKVAPEIVYPQPNTWRDAEHRRTVRQGNFLLIGIYDLLILSDSQAQIIDWKTYPQPPNQETLKQNWQTRLYQYLFAKTSTYSPENIQLTYWFIAVPHKPTSVTFSYSQVQHDATEQELNEILTHLEQDYKSYQKNQVSFPKVEPEKKYCLNCPFTLPCQRQFAEKQVFLSEVEEQII